MQWFSNSLASYPGLLIKSSFSNTATIFINQSCMIWYFLYLVGKKWIIIIWLTFAFKLQGKVSNMKVSTDSFFLLRNIYLKLLFFINSGSAGQAKQHRLEWIHRKQYDDKKYVPGRTDSHTLVTSVLFGSQVSFTFWNLKKLALK